MTAYTAKSFLAVSALTLAAFAVPAGAQVVRDGTSGGVQGTDVSASTCGEGTTTGTSITVSGCADATATNGTASTTSRARTNERMGMQRSTATARDDDERARSRTQTMVRQGEVVRSRTMSMYKEKGERPVREVTSTSSTPKQTTTPPKKKPQ
jgi:hypothetical protein